MASKKETAEAKAPAPPAAPPVDTGYSPAVDKYGNKIVNGAGKQLMQLKVVFIKNGKPRVWLDDGDHRTGRPGIRRKQIAAALSEQDADGNPMFYAMEPVKQRFNGIPVPVVNERVLASQEQYIKDNKRHERAIMDRLRERQQYINGK